MKHQFKRIDNPPTQRPFFRCDVCRMLVVAASEEVRHMERAKALLGECPGPFIVEPHKSLKYLGCLQRWLKANRPRRTADEVSRVFATHCQSCDQRTTENVCLAKECRVLPSGPPECNMIALKTERCPLGKWGDDAVSVPQQTTEQRAKYGCGKVT